MQRCLISSLPQLAWEKRLCCCCLLKMFDNLQHAELHFVILIFITAIDDSSSLFDDSLAFVPTGELANTDLCAMQMLKYHNFPSETRQSDPSTGSFEIKMLLLNPTI